MAKNRNQYCFDYFYTLSCLRISFLSVLDAYRVSVDRLIFSPEPAASYPAYTPMLIRAQELWFHEPAVTTPVLKLFAELAQNRLDSAAVAD